MKRQLLIVLGLLLAPFFIQANESVYGKAAPYAPSETTVTTGQCNYNSANIGRMQLEACYDAINASLSSGGGLRNCSPVNISSTATSTNFDMSCEQKRVVFEDGEYVSYWDGVYVKRYNSWNNIQSTLTRTCPSADNTGATYAHEVGGIIASCYDPVDLNENDSCDTPSMSVLPRGDQNAEAVCRVKEDGSRCEYQLDLINNVYVSAENGCWNIGHDEYDESLLDENPPPIDDTCKQYGSDLMCPTDPDDVCTGLGTTSPQCQSGCGYVNDSFMCIDQDTDGDGIQDFNDPDKDGDGIANEDDLDADGDGQDDPIIGQGNNVVGSGSSTTVNIDLQPVVDAVNGTTNAVNDLGDKIDGLLESGSNNPTPSEFSEQFKTYEEAFNEALTGKASEADSHVPSDINQMTQSLSFGDGIVDKFPTASACTPWTWQNFTIDLCPHVPTIQLILNFIIAVLTFMYVFDEANAALRPKES